MSEQEPIYGDPDKLAALVEERKARGPVEPLHIEPAPIATPSAFTGFVEMAERMKAAHPPKTEAEMREWEWRNTVTEHLQASKLPPRFHYEVGHWQEPKQEATYRSCRNLLKRTGAIVALLGPRGLGKTTIAAQLIIDRAWNVGLQPWERRPPYRKMADLIATFKPLYAAYGSINIEALMERREFFCRHHPLVVIDEIHECDDLALKDKILTDLLDRRYANRTDTLLISNQSVEEFKRTTNDSILSRLSEHGRVLVCSWDSFRMK